MIDDKVVIDAVIHGYLLQSAGNGSEEFSESVAALLYHGVHLGFHPRGQEKWLMSEERFRRGDDADLVGSAVFEESWTDAAVYHGVPAYGVFAEGGSPMRVGVELQQRYPGRVFLYAPVTPLGDSALDEVDQAVDEYGASGIKFYPMDIVEGRAQSWRMDDPEVCFPIIEKARSRGIRNIAIHKAIPLGPTSMDPFRPGDVEGAAEAFPDVTFEIVHGGFAFLEETALQLARFPNIVVNLEGASAYICNQPRKFAEIIGTFLLNGGADKIVWGTGCMAVHPQPFLEAFKDFRMPQDLMEGYGYPPLDDELKAKILGGTMARLLGVDAQSLASPRTGELLAPWSGGAAVPA